MPRSKSSPWSQGLCYAGRTYKPRWTSPDFEGRRFPTEPVVRTGTAYMTPDGELAVAALERAMQPKGNGEPPPATHVYRFPRTGKITRP